MCGIPKFSSHPFWTVYTDSKAQNTSRKLQMANQRPSAQDIALITLEDHPAGIQVLPYVTDPNLPNDNLTVSILDTRSMHGQVMVNYTLNQTIFYTPDRDYNGFDSFVYFVTDSGGLTAMATINVTVISVNDKPIAMNDGGVTSEETPVTIDVLANDDDPDFAYGDGDALTVSIAPGMGPYYGVVVVNANNTVTYVPDIGFRGPDVFTYMVSDTGGVNDTAQVAIVVGDPFNCALPSSKSKGKSTTKGMSKGMSTAKGMSSSRKSSKSLGYQPVGAEEDMDCTHGRKLRTTGTGCGSSKSANSTTT